MERPSKGVADGGSETRGEDKRVGGVHKDQMSWQRKLRGSLGIGATRCGWRG